MSNAAAPFTAPRSCSTTWVDGGLYVSVGVQCSSGKLVDDPNCIPPTATACPFNWRPVATKNAITTCCPSEYDLNPDVAGRCYSNAGGFVLQGVTCNPNAAPTIATITYGFTPGVWAVAVSYGGGAEPTSSSSGNPDSASSSVASTITPAPSTPSNGIPPAPTNTSSSASATTTSAATSSSPLSGGAIAGIVVGSVAAIAVIIAAIVLLKRRRGTSETVSAHLNTRTELDANEIHPIYEKGAYSPRHSVVHPVELETHNPMPNVNRG